jgi:hypothetical protein
LAITNRRLCERDLTSLCSRSCEATRVAVAMPMNANQHPYPLTQTRFDEHDASFSPDGCGRQSRSSLCMRLSSPTGVERPACQSTLLFTPGPLLNRHS